MSKPLRFRVIPQEEGMMLGHLVARRMPGATVEQGRDLVRAGAVYIGHLRVRVPTVRVVTGERITVHAGGQEVQPLDADAVRFVHRDPTFVVLDKPAGVPVAATRATARGTLAEALRRVLAGEGVVRPYVGVLHRLDRGASGLVAMTTRSAVNPSLHRQFSHHEIQRFYRVLVHGDVGQTLTCDVPLLELHSGTTKPGAGNPRARPARTMFRPLRAKHPRAGTTLLEAQLDTGRHHQIRVHAKFLGHPVVGDARYGETGSADRLHLHAWRLVLNHPVTGAELDLRCDCPPWAAAVEDIAPGSMTTTP